MQVQDVFLQRMPTAVTAWRQSRLDPCIHSSRLLYAALVPVLEPLPV